MRDGCQVVGEMVASGGQRDSPLCTPREAGLSRSFVPRQTRSLFECRARPTNNPRPASPTQAQRPIVFPCAPFSAAQLLWGDFAWRICFEGWGIGLTSGKESGILGACGGGFSPPIGFARGDREICNFACGVDLRSDRARRMLQSSEIEVGGGFDGGCGGGGGFGGGCEVGKGEVGV